MINPLCKLELYFHQQFITINILFISIVSILNIQSFSITKSNLIVTLLNLINIFKVVINGATVNEII